MLIFVQANKKFEIWHVWKQPSQSLKDTVIWLVYNCCFYSYILLPGRQYDG